MTFFGQFFDHGLDLVTKGGAGTVYIPLQADDPLIAGADGIFGNGDDLPAHLRFMALTRATADARRQWRAAAREHHHLVHRPEPDLHLACLAPGVPARICEGCGGPRGQHRQAARRHRGERLGRRRDRQLGRGQGAGARRCSASGSSDFDVHNVPLLLTDQYGKFIPGANGYAQLVMAPDADACHQLAQGRHRRRASPLPGSIGTGHAFLNDIAHHAAPAIVDHDHNPATPTDRADRRRRHRPQRRRR